MSLDHILLAILREPASGYDLKKVFSESIRHFWFAELSQLYPALQRLEKNGFLKSKTTPSDKGPPRRVYRRTVAGRNELCTWLRSGPQIGTERFAYVAQLAFMHELSDLEETLDFLHMLRERFAGIHRILQAFDEEESEGYPNDVDLQTFHEVMSLRMGVASIKAKLDWCDESIKSVTKRMRKEKQDA